MDAKSIKNKSRKELQSKFGFIFESKKGIEEKVQECIYLLHSEIERLVSKVEFMEDTITAIEEELDQDDGSDSDVCIEEDTKQLPKRQKKN